MSRRHNARRKAKRQQARSDAEAARRPGARWQRRLTAVLPILIIAGIFAAVAISGFGSSSGMSKQQVKQEVSTTLAGLPQHDRTLGSPHAPLTIVIYADLECPTVRLFALSYLPELLDTWVRPGLVQLQYHALETDTVDEHTFFEQEEATLAAGRQNRLWDFVLTFLHEQEQEYTGYATAEFLSGIGTQVNGLDKEQWRKDRRDPAVSEHVALDVQAAHERDIRYTPSFVLAPTRDKAGTTPFPAHDGALWKEVWTSLTRQVTALRQESLLDNPTLQEAEVTIQEFNGQ